MDWLTSQLFSKHFVFSLERSQSSHSLDEKLVNENAKPERGMNRIQSGSRGRNANMHQKENNHCVLSRSIGTSDARLILVLTQKKQRNKNMDNVISILAYSTWQNFGA